LNTPELEMSPKMTLECLTACYQVFEGACTLTGLASFRSLEYVAVEDGLSSKTSPLIPSDSHHIISPNKK
jgi:hypothetical protein